MFLHYQLEIVFILIRLHNCRLVCGSVYYSTWVSILQYMGQYTIIVRQYTTVHGSVYYYSTSVYYSTWVDSVCQYTTVSTWVSILQCMSVYYSQYVSQYITVYVSILTCTILSCDSPASSAISLGTSPIVSCCTQ